VHASVRTLKAPEAPSFVGMPVDGREHQKATESDDLLRNFFGQGLAAREK
jgi:hypothetical protein